MAQKIGSTRQACFLQYPEDYYDWLSLMAGLVPVDEWKFYDPETNDAYTEPREPHPSDLNPTAETLFDLSESDRITYLQLTQIYDIENDEYWCRMENERKLYNAIHASVNRSLTAWRPDKTGHPNRVRILLTAIRDHMKPSQKYMQRHTKQLRGNLLTRFVDWPDEGPQEWIAEWTHVLALSKEWCPSAYEEWDQDFQYVWSSVPGMGPYCDMLCGDHNEAPSSAARMLLAVWSRESRY